MKSQILDTGVEALHNKDLQKPSPYYAKTLDSIDNGKGCWESLRVGIFERVRPLDGDRLIGEYIRNYPCLYRTFHPFQLRDKWYALYSKDYTSIRLMELPSCKDIGGEAGYAYGFCPVDFWVPPLHYLEVICDPDCPRYESPEHEPDYTKACTCREKHGEGCPLKRANRKPGEIECNESEECKRLRQEYEAARYKWHFPDRVHGFVAGCVWGDDSTWKIEYLDLSRADEGIVKREARFGYVEMATKCNLSEAVEIEVDKNGVVDDFRLSVLKRIDFETGKEIGEV